VWIKRISPLRFVGILALVTIGIVCWVVFLRPVPQPQIGILAATDSLAHDLLLGFPDIKVKASQKTTAMWHDLDTGVLDYLITTEPKGGYLATGAGILVPAAICSYFSPAHKTTESELKLLLVKDASEPPRLLISDKLSVPGFFWSTMDVTYLPSEQIITRLARDQTTLGIVPIQDRQATVRVLPVDDVTPTKESVMSGEYKLARRIYLVTKPPNPLTRLKHLLRNHNPGICFEKHIASTKNPYQNPWINEITLAAVGDVMLNRDVEKEGRQHGWEHVFDEVAGLLRQADLAFCNLESPIGSAGRFINMFQAPPDAVTGLTHAGFDVVSLANNHSLDYHNEGLFDTIRILNENDLASAGAGRDIDEARQPVIKEVNGTRVGFLAYTEMWFVYAREPHNWAATETTPGVVPAELKYIIEDVRRLRDRVDIVITSFHWGKEYQETPTTSQITLARAAIDAGADLVLGHHPHVLQGIEFYNGGIIAYSLGNFVFDLKRSETWNSVTVCFTLSPRGVLDMQIHPVYIEGVRPRLLTGTHRRSLYDYIRRISLGLQ